MTKSRNKQSGVRRFLGALKWLVPLAVVGGLVALAYRPQPVAVDTGVVTRGAMMLTVDDDGETRVRERYMVSAPLAGRLLRIGLDPGDAVKKGDALATIQPAAPNLLDPRARAQAEAMVMAAKAGVASAETQAEARAVEAEQLRAAYERSKVLFEKGNVAAASFEQAEGAYLAAKHAHEAALSAVEVARFELAQAEAALIHSEGESGTDDVHFVIPSPVDGTVLRVHGESSRMVQPGEMLLEVGDPSDVEMRIDVLSQDAVKIESGQKVIVEHWGGDAELTGRVRRVEPSAYTKVSALGVDEQRVDVIADFESPEALPGDGFRVEARVVIWESANAVQVPAGALFRNGDSWAVYLADGDAARLVEVEIDRNNGEVANVLSGLEEGDRVVLHPGDRVEEGTLIEARE